MGTHCLIGRLDESGQVTAASVHYDGYPTHMGETLRVLVDRDGLETALAVLHSGRAWRGLDADQEPGRGETVLGYGEAFSDADRLLVKPLPAMLAYLGGWSYVFSADGSVLSVFYGTELVEEVSARHLISADWTDIERRGWED